MKRKIVRVLLTLILVIALTISASCSTKLQSIEFVPDFSQDRMIETIRVLSAEDGGRIAGFEGEADIAEYISGQFDLIGLEVSEQIFPVKAFACEKVSLKLMVDNDVLTQPAKALTFSVATPAEGLSAEIVPVGMGADDDYNEIDVSGKMVLIMRGGEFFRVKTERAYKNGAVAAIFYDPNGEGAISATLTQLSAIPAISIARMDAEKMIKSITEGNTVDANLVVDSITEDSFSKNVIGLYKSSNNPESNCVIVGAHYDGVDTPAANDNASGTAVIIEMAKVLAEQKIHLPYDVKFIAFGAEEIGLIGSTAFVTRMSRSENESVLAMINFDMVGVGDSFELYTADGIDDSELIDITAEVIKQMGFEPEISKTDRSDHSPFSYAGIQAVYIAVGPFEDYHTDLDTLNAIQPAMLVNVCEVGTKMLIEELPKWLK